MLSIGSHPVPEKKSPVEHTLPAPARRRVIYEHGMDMTLGFKWAVGACAVLGLACLLQSVVLVMIFRRPPVVLDQNDGYIMWRTTEFFKLRPEMIERYLRVTLGTLYTISPGVNELGTLTGLVDPRILKAFLAQDDPELVTLANQRRVYRLRDVRRWSDPNAPGFITLVVRGERALYEYNPAALNPFKLEDRPVTQLVYLRQVLPRPDNPWGLEMAGLMAKSGAEAEALWAASVPLTAESKEEVKPTGVPDKEEKKGILFSK